MTFKIIAKSSLHENYFMQAPAGEQWTVVFDTLNRFIPASELLHILAGDAVVTILGGMHGGASVMLQLELRSKGDVSELLRSLIERIEQAIDNPDSIPGLMKEARASHQYDDEE